MVTLLNDSALWDDLLRSAHKAFWPYEDRLDDVLFWTDWKTTMVTPDGDWLEPPGFEHYSMEDVEGPDTFFQLRLARGVRRFAAMGPVQFQKMQAEVLNDWKRLLSSLSLLDLKYRQHWLAGFDVPSNDYYRSVPTHRRTAGLRDWADRELELGARGLDGFVHRGHDHGVQVAIAETISAAYRRRDALPLPEAWRSLGDEAAQEGMSTQTVQTARSRTDHEIVCAVADLHRRSGFEGLHTRSALASAVYKMKRRSPDPLAARFFSRTTVYNRLESSIQAVLGVDIIDGRLDLLIPVLEKFEAEGRPPSLTA